MTIPPDIGLAMGPLQFYGRSLRRIAARIAFYTLPLLMLLATPISIAQSVHKCVDKGGKITYSDQGCNAQQQSAGPNPQAGYVISNSPSADGGSASDNYNQYLQMRQAEKQQAHEEAVAAQRSGQVAPVYQQRPRSDADIDEQTRRCNMENDSLAKHSDAECLKLRAMLNMPERTRVIREYQPFGLGRTVHEGEPYMNFGKQCQMLGGVETCKTENERW